MDPEKPSPLTNISLYVGLVVVLIFALAIYGVFKLYQKRVTSQTVSPTPTPQSFGTLPSPAPSTAPIQAANPPQTLPAAGSETLEVKNAGIFVSVPKVGQIINSPLFISGTANITSQTVQIIVKNSLGEILGQGQAKACLAIDACPFETSIGFTKTPTPTGTIEIYSINIVNGQEEYLQTIPIIFSN